MPQSEVVPRLAEGVRLLGAYDSPGLTTPKFIAQRADGQVVLLSQLLYLTAANLDGSPLDLVATKVSDQGERPVNGREVQYLAQKLAPLGLVALQEDACPVNVPTAAPILGMAGKPLIPTRAVRAIAWCLLPLFFWPVVVLALVGTVLADTWAFMTQPVLASLGTMVLHPAYLLGALGLLASATLFHEFGHATACRYGGGKPGAIGAGMYLMFPAFYTDVTDSYRLTRRARLRVDLGGVYFNTIWIVAAALVWRFTGYVPALVILAFSNLVIIQQLLPVVRFDGYWVLSDLVGVPDLFGRIKPAFKSIARRRAPADLTMKATVIVTAWVVVIVPLLLGSAALMLTRMPGYARRTFDSWVSYYHEAVTSTGRHEWSALALAAVMMLFLLLPVAGISIMMVRTSQSIGTLAVAKWPKPYQPRHMLREPPTIEDEPYVFELLHAKPSALRVIRAKRPQRPLPRERRGTEPNYWPTQKPLEWWEVRPPPEPTPGKRRPWRA